MSDIIKSIRGLVQAIPEQCGVYAGFSEGYKPGGVTLTTAYVETKDGSPMLFQGSNHPRDGQLTLEQVRDELAEWIAENRKQEAA